MRSLHALIQDHKRLEAENKELEKQIAILMLENQAFKDGTHSHGPFAHNYGPYKGTNL